jgi:hypothetical protein
MTAFPFKAFLDKCQNTTLAEPDHEWKTFDLGIIGRWQDHAFADGAWEMIEKAATRDGRKPLWPGDLVEWIIEQARIQKRLVEEVVPKSSEIERKVISAAEKDWRTSRDGIGGAWAGTRRDFAQQHRANRIRILGRQPNPRKRFIRLCRELFIANCGQPLDEVIEMLVYVVSGHETKDNEVRDALKASTRAGRTPKLRNSQ